MNTIRHPQQRSSRLSEHDSLFETVPPATWPPIEEPVPVGEASESDWAEFEEAERAAA